jgi:hypothetical protein
MKTPKNIQVIKIALEPGHGGHCGQDFSELTNTKYTGKEENFPAYKLEHFKCKKCKKPFVVRYDLLDENGHLDDLVFADDPNDPEASLMSYFSNEQKNLVANHLISCEHCRQKRDEAILENALVADFLSICRAAGKRF